ncbi:spermatogenesis-associated protein 21 isoform X2 [Bos taurus]|uniref:spermatogenesis-associated protein 21 isoform X2 n=1 Tax=Bos taurus TaxID=9913 RepID=UPI000D535D97|nr:spermatogenesis-associated protein 21 isoform X2 [Bos taurus]
MDSGNTQMYVEDRIEAPGARPSPGLRTASDRAGDEPTTSEVCQAVFPDAEAMDSGPQPAPALGALETGPGHRDASEEGFPQLSPQEQKPPAGPGTKLSSWVPQEGRRELQAHQDLATPGSELGVPPNGVPVTQKGLQQQGSGKETEDQQGSQQNPEPVEGQGPESRQDPEGEPIPGRLAASESDTVQPTEPYCTLDSCEQQLEDKPPKEVDTPPIGPQRALPEPGPGGCEDSSQEEVSLMPTATLEEKTVHTAPPPRPRSDTPKARDEAVEIQPTLGPARPPEAVDTGARGLDPTQKQPQEPAAATGARDPGSARPGFMRRLLEVEEEEAALRRAAKARALPGRRCPRALGPVPAPAPSLPPPLPAAQAPASASARAWARPPVPAPVPAPAGTPGPAPGPAAVLPVPASDLAWRRTELLSHSRERSLKARQELEERCLLNVCQTWEERAEEHLTMKQEEAFRSYFEIFNGHGEVDAQSLENILLLVGISLTTAQVEGALRSADIDGDGHVNFKDFLTVMTDTRRFFCSVEQNALMDMAPPNPDTLFFEILSLLVEMLALPEGALEEITSYYQRKLKEGACKARETESATGRLRPRKKLPYSPPQADTLEIPERRVLRVLSRLKQQNYAANLQSPYAQVPCIPLCPRLDKKTVRRKQGGHYELEQCPSPGLGPDIHSILLHTGSQGGREPGHLSSVPARTH